MADIGWPLGWRVTLWPNFAAFGAGNGIVGRVPDLKAYATLADVFDFGGSLTNRYGPKICTD